MPGEADITDIRLFRRLAEGTPTASRAAMAARRKLPGWAVPLGLLALDALAWGLVFVARAGAADDRAVLAGPMALFLVLAVAALGRHGSYGDGLAAVGPRQAAGALGGALGISLLAVALLRADAGAAETLALAGLAMLAGRILAALMLHATGTAWLVPRAVLVGAAADVLDLLAEFPGGSAQPRVLGWIDDGHMPGAVLALPHLGGMDRLEELARTGLVDQVILAAPTGGTAAREATALIRRCASWPVEIRLARPWLAGRSSRLGGWELAHVLERPATFWAGLAKRSEDVLLGALLLVVFALPMALLALAIRLDSPGPVLFRQRRIGFQGQSFQMFKFRTMRHDPAPMPGCVQAVRGDPRVTRLGAFLRKTSLDELPQLFNVLGGKMSLVGPRPHAPGTSANGRHFEDVVPFYEGRHRVKPGITGLAQVRGLRGETRTEADVLARVEADYEYMQRWSLGLDLLILLRTALAVLSMRNAY